MRRRQSFVGDTMHKLYLQDKGPTIHAILEFEEVIDLKKLKDLLKTSMIPYPRFSSRLDESGQYWESVTVDIDQHVDKVILTLEDKEDDYMYEDPVLHSVEDYVGSVLHKKFNPDIPLWTVTVLSHPSNDRCFVVFRISHSIGDGIVLSSLLLSMAEGHNENIPIEKIKDKKLKSGMVSKVLNKLMSFVRMIKLCLWVPLIVQWSCLKLVASFIGSNDIATAIKPNQPSDLGDVKLFARGNPISVPLMKEIAKAAVESNGRDDGRKYTVNDVLMAAIAGGVRRYSQLCRHPTGYLNNRFPVRFLSIVNTRSSSGMSDEKKMLADYGAGKFGNEFSHFVIGMNVGPMRPHARLDEIQGTMSRVKQSPEGIITNYSNKLIWLIGGSTLLEKTTRYFFGKFQSFVSNLMAPQIPLKFAGCRLKYLYNCTAPMVFGCTFNVMSYNKNLIVSCACDAKV